MIKNRINGKSAVRVCGIMTVKTINIKWSCITCAASAMLILRNKSEVTGAQEIFEFKILRRHSRGLLYSRCTGFDRHAKIRLFGHMKLLRRIFEYF